MVEVFAMIWSVLFCYKKSPRFRCTLALYLAFSVAPIESPHYGRLQSLRWGWYRDFCARPVPAFRVRLVRRWSSRVSHKVFPVNSPPACDAAARRMTLTTCFTAVLDVRGADDGGSLYSQLPVVCSSSSSSSAAAGGRRRQRERRNALMVSRTCRRTTAASAGARRDPGPRVEDGTDERTSRTAWGESG